MSKKEYIEREATLKALSRGQGCGNICSRSIDRIPAADVVKVIRCVDCEHFRHFGDAKICLHWNCHSTKADAYCSFAKMKGGE